MGRWGDGEMGRWGNGEIGKWGNGEMGKWGNGETTINHQPSTNNQAITQSQLTGGDYYHHYQC